MAILKKCYTLKKLYFGLFGSILGLLLLSNPKMLHAQIQDFSVKNYSQNSIDIQKSGMMILGTWATLNIFTGGIGNFRARGKEKYFHQMNAAWNFVNLGIAGIGYYGAMNANLNVADIELLTEMQKFDRILLINAALDIGYMATGAYLWKRGQNNSNLRLEGYGQSIVLQGAFLFSFDLFLYLIHNQVTDKAMALNEALSFTGNGFRLNF